MAGGVSLCVEAAVAGYSGCL